MTPTALSIAGLDPSGGAGIAADLRSFASAGAWGAAVCACLTVQSTRGVRRVVPVAASLLLEQAREVLEDARVMAFKTGALGSAANVRSVTALLAAYPNVPSVVDPVMIPSRRTGGATTLHGSRISSLRSLLAVATLVTPNLDETSALLGHPITSERDARDAAVALVGAGAGAALVKGGHGTGAVAVDWLAVGDRVVRIARPRRRMAEVHGTGCTLSSLIAGRLAAQGNGRPPRPEQLVEAVRWARTQVDHALAHPLVVGAGLQVLNVRGRNKLA